MERAEPVEMAQPARADDFVGVPLSVVFASGERIEAVRSKGEGTLPLEPPYHVSDEETYLVIPDDIGLELVDILRDGDRELLGEAMRDGLLAVGGIVQREDGSPALLAEQALTPGDVSGREVPYAAAVTVGGTADPLEQMNTLEHAQCTVISALVDDEGLDRMLRRSEYIGVSWKVPPELGGNLGGIDPTLVWSRRLDDGRIGVELALFQEYEELVALLRPVVLRPAS